MSTAQALADWAHALTPTDADLALAERSLTDTVAVALAARSHPLVPMTAGLLGEAGHWAAAGHVLDFDDLHMESTAHVSVVIVPTVLACGGDALAYLAGAGVMARIGIALGWRHYEHGWHATCTAGAPGAAVAAAISLGLSPVETAHAIALSIPAAGGVQQAFGTVAKPIQVGFAAGAGVRAARLAQAGARSDLRVVDEWFKLVQPTAAVRCDGPAVPGGLAIKLFPCCYAMQRPIGVMRSLKQRIGSASIERITVRTPRGTVHPLIHTRPHTGLEGKFSLEYALAAALLDEFPDFESFTTPAVTRPAAEHIVAQVTPVLSDDATDTLLAGECEIEVLLADGSRLAERLRVPPGSPELPPTDAEFAAKLAACGDDVPRLLVDVSGARLSWQAAAALLREQLPTQ